MVGVAKKLMDKAGKEGEPWISGLFDYRLTPQSGSIASPFATDNSAHTQGKEFAPIAQCTWCSRNAPSLSEAHQKAREQALKEVPRITPRYISLGAT